MTSITILPSKILVKIFQYLDLNDLVSVRRVNKRFLKSTEDGNLYRRVRFSRIHREDDVVATLRRHNKSIEECYMENFADSNTLLQYVSRCKNLRKLKLKECEGERGIKEATFRALFAATQIQQFTLKKCELEKFPQLNLHNVTSLVVIDNTGYQQQPLEYVDHLLPLIQANRNSLVSLKLCVDNISDAGKQQLFKHVQRCANLRVFRFQYPHVDDVNEENFKRLLKLQNLTSLSIIAASTISEKVYHDFVVRTCTNKLRKLELAGEICRLLPSIMRSCPNLEILRLHCMSKPFIQISNEDLLNLLSTCKKLKEVSLKTVSVNNLRHTILQLPTYLPNLRYAEIEMNKVEERSDSSITPLKIEFNLLPNFALETQIFDQCTVYTLFRSEELLKYITS